MAEKVTYGQRGQKTGVPKAQQARNKPNATDTAYMTPEQQAKVTSLLGDSYDPTKPLNVQLFQAQWAGMTPAQRKAFADKQASQFLSGGPSVKTLSQFHNTYLQELNAQNVELQRMYDEHLANYSQTGGGFAISGEQAQANLAYWKTFAASPEGQAHIAQTGMTQEDWLKSTLGDIHEGVQNYQQQQKQYSTIQNLAARLGLEVPGFVAPGWASTLEGIKAGQGPLPSADYLAMYPGSAKDLVGVENTYTTAGHIAAVRGGGTAQGTTQETTAGFQPFTDFTGVQQPDTFSERDLYQSTQSR